MNVGTVIAWIVSNMGFVTQVISAIEKVAGDLQNFHGNNSLDAYAKAVIAAIDSFFSGLGANTTTTAAEDATIGNATNTISTPTALPSLTPQ